MTLKLLERNTFIFVIWTLVYFYCLNWFLKTNWGFDMFYGWHWRYIIQQWWYDGWIIQGTYYWTFILTLFLAVPVWIIGYCVLMTIPYGRMYERLFWNQIYGRKTKAVQSAGRKVRVRKKRSYKEVRPKPLSNTFTVPAQKMPDNLLMDEASAGQSMPAKENTHFSHRELADDLGFNMEAPFGDAGSDEGLLPLNLMEEKKEPVVEDLPKIMQDAGCRVLTDVIVGDMQIDWMAIAKDKIYFVQKDSEEGEWLADEERFNNEDPLWYSESSHRVSPVTLLLQKQEHVLSLLKTAGIRMTGQSILVKDKGTIINAEDMMATWAELKVTVCRTNSGQPDELPLFEAAFPADNEAPEETSVDNIRQALGTK